MYLGNMLSDAKIRKIFIEIIREAVLLADKMNTKIEIFGGKFDFKKFIRGSDRYSDLKRHLTDLTNIRVLLRN
jgi:2-dehydropantoate 2-reductase